MPCLRAVPIKTKNKKWWQRARLHKSYVRNWEVYKQWKFKRFGTIFVIPKSFIFDGASIPKYLWSSFGSPTGVLFVPGLIHDFAYRYGYIWVKYSDGEYGKYYGNQKHWDDLFCELGKDMNNSKAVSRVAWSMLRMFGRFAWKANRKRNAPEMKPAWWL